RLGGRGLSGPSHRRGLRPPHRVDPNHGGRCLRPWALHRPRRGLHLLLVEQVWAGRSPPTSAAPAHRRRSHAGGETWRLTSSGRTRPTSPPSPPPCAPRTWPSATPTVGLLPRPWRSRSPAPPTPTPRSPKVSPSPCGVFVRLVFSVARPSRGVSPVRAFGDARRRSSEGAGHLPSTCGGGTSRCGTWLTHGTLGRYVG